MRRVLPTDPTNRLQLLGMLAAETMSAIATVLLSLGVAVLLLLALPFSLVSMVPLTAVVFASSAIAYSIVLAGIAPAVDIDIPYYISDVVLTESLILSVAYVVTQATLYGSEWALQLLALLGVFVALRVLVYSFGFIYIIALSDAIRSLIRGVRR